MTLKCFLLAYGLCLVQGAVGAVLATAPVGKTAVFSVTADGTNTAPDLFTYQWLKEGTPIPQATQATYTLSSVAMADAGSYSVVVTNSAGSTTSDLATLTVIPATMAILTATITSTGYPPPAIYTWRKDGQTIPGANTATYTFDAAAAPGSYSLTTTWPNIPKTP